MASSCQWAARQLSTVVCDSFAYLYIYLYSHLSLYCHWLSQLSTMQVLNFTGQAFCRNMVSRYELDVCNQLVCSLARGLVDRFLEHKLRP